jgi:hypothetical protein
MVQEMRPREAVLQEVPWRGRVLPAEVDMTDLITESQAEMDAEVLLAKYSESGGYRSRRQVALGLGYRDNDDGYGKGIRRCRC